MHKKLNKLGQIGGHIELNENPWQALCHEVEEESGYRFNDLFVLQPPDRLKIMHGNANLHPLPTGIFTHDFSDSHKHTDIFYSFVTYGPPKFSVANGESLDLRWLDQEELDNLDDNELFSGIKEVYNFILDTCIKSWERTETTKYF